MNKGYLDLIEAIFRQAKSDYVNAEKWLALHPEKPSDKKSTKITRAVMTNHKAGVVRFLRSQWGSFLAQCDMNADYIIARWNEEVRANL